MEPNPGPDSVENISLSSSSSAASLATLQNLFSIMHLNIQSLTPKIDLVRSESTAYDVMIFTESWLNPSVSNETIATENFPDPIRYDRTDRIGGGVAMYIRDNIFFKRRSDLEIANLEAVWVELSIKCKKILIGGFYRPPNSRAEYFNLIQESFERACNTNIKDIVILGDFNYNMYNLTNNKMLDLIQQYNFTQIIQDSTHFTEHSESLIDLILVSNLNNIVTSDTSDLFIDNQVRFHCPIICVLKFLKPIPKTYKRRIWLYDKADFNYFRNILATTDWNFISNEQNLDLIVENFNNVLLQAADKSIPNKIATIRPTEYPWINGLIRKLIRKRKRLYRKAKRTNSEQVWQKFKRTRNIVTNELRKSKQEYLDKLTDQLNVEKVNPKTFWKISKQLLKLDISSSSIPPLNINGHILESDQEKATALNEYFSSQATVNDTNKSLPLIVPLTYPALTSITITRCP